MTDRFSDLLKERFVVAVSLPANDVALAKAAETAGADALKLHINVHHRASGTTFGTWTEERETIEEILSSVNIPVGIMAGDDPDSVRRDAPHMVGKGLAFLDAYADHIPASILHSPPAPLMPALGAFHSIRRARSLSELPGVSCIEASIVYPDDYGKPLTMYDLSVYRELVADSLVPILIPSQKRLVPDDLPALAQVGCAGVLLGVVVLGSSAESIAAGVRRFKESLSTLPMKEARVRSIGEAQTPPIGEAQARPMRGAQG